MSNPEWHFCDCGYKWRHGQSGGHHCKEYYIKRIMVLANEVTTLAATIRAANEQAAEDIIKLADSDLVLMPRELTAENGAKGLLMGDFKESYEVDCHACGVDHMIYPDGPGECEVCHGEGRLTQYIIVSWTTIKEIYEKAVKHLEVKP